MLKSKYLSVREQNVIKLIALNYTNKKIAKELYMSESTIKSEVSNIIKKLNANGRIHATVIAYKNRLISN